MTQFRAAGRFAGLTIGLAMALALGLTSAPGATAEDGAASNAASAAASGSTWAYDLAGDLMSPFCPGRTLASCPSPQAAELIQWIATQEAAGVSRDEVIAILVERHGEEILGAPPAKGITLWAYVFPVLGFVVFGGIAVIVLRRIVGTRDEAGPLPLPLPVPVASQSASVTPAQAAARGAAADELARIVDAELAERA
jgi:cytochrome c-type biogenesis protein CcmH/NrfF